MVELRVFTEQGEREREGMNVYICANPQPHTHTHTHTPLMSLSGSRKHPLRKQQAELIWLT